MSFTDFKEVSSNNSGSASRYGGNDLKEVMQILNNKVVSSRRVSIKNPWIWTDYFDMKPPAGTPSSPTDTNASRIYVDPSDFKIKIKKVGGGVVDLENVNIPNTALNQITDKAKLHGSIVYNDQNNNLGAFWHDVAQIATPSNPAAGTRRIFVNSATGELSVRTSAGITVSLETLASAGDVQLNATNTYGDFDSIFRSSRVKIRNPANTFSYSLVGSAIAAARNVTLPLLTADDTLVTAAFGQTLTTKTINVDQNTIKDSTTNAAGDLLKGNATSFVRFARGTANQVLSVNAGGTDLVWATPAGGGNVSTTASNTYGDFDQIFRSGRLDVTNPANTFNYSLTGSAIAANRVLTLPLLTADDTLVTEAFTQTVTNKTVNATNNTITDTSTALGDLLVSNGSKFVRRARGSSLQVLRTNSAGTDLEWAAPTGGGGGSPRLLRHIFVNSDGTADYTTIGAAITALNAIPGNLGVVIHLSAETYDISTRLEATRGNFKIVGAGSGRTIVRGTTSLPQTDAIFRIQPFNSNTGYNLTANATAGAISVTMSAANSANFSTGMYVLLKDLTDIDTEFPGRKKGELHQVTNVNTGTGVVTLDGTIYETYTTAQTAKLAPLTTFYENVTLEGMTFTSARTTVTGMTEGTTNFYYIRNLQFVDIEWKDVFRAAVEVRQCWDTSFDRCKIKNVLAPTDAPTVFYGIQIMSASLNTKVIGLESEFNRHGVTQGAGSGTNLEGRTRTLIVDGCTLRNTTESHLDVHQGAVGVIFSNNTCISDDTNANAIQCRSPSLVIGNNIFGIKGKGIYLFGQAHQTAIIGNMISGCTEGIFVDVDNHRLSIVGNTIQNCTNDGIFFQATTAIHAGDDTMIANNQILNNGGDGIEINSCVGMMIATNFIRNNTGVSIREVDTDATLNNIQIFANYIAGNGTNTPILLGTGNRIRHNFGVTTENAGSATVSSGTTSTTVTHGMAYTPSVNDIGLILTNNTTNDIVKFYVTNVTATQFTINVGANPGTSGAIFGWSIQRTT